jgi:hypothetical protein
VLTLAETNILDMHDGLSNCYLVKPGESVTIPITRAITVGGLPTSTTNDAITLASLWEDSGVISNISEITGSGNDREFTVSTNATGNAVIKLEKNGTIYWSWHIWVCDPAEIGTWTNNNNGVVFMNRYLGATANAESGYAYQWGRKDPFPYRKSGANSYNLVGEFSFSEEVDDQSQNRKGAVCGVLQSIRNPKTWFKGLPDDWLPFSQLYLWNTSTNEKSIYDPCPVDWRVPNMVTPWLGYGNGNFDTKLYTVVVGWNVSGGVTSADGTHDAGSYHGMWTSYTENDDKTYTRIGYVHYSYTWDNGWALRQKACGFSVRCVPE